MKFVAVVAASGLAAAAPALATEGPPAGGGPSLPNTLAPIGIPAPGQPPVTRKARPRVLAAQVTPRRVVTGRRSRLRVALAGPGKIRVIVERMGRGGHRHRVLSRTVAAPLAGRIVRLPARLRPGRYRVTTIAFDDQGARSPGVRRMLVVVRR